MSSGSRNSHGISGGIDRDWAIAEVVNVDDKEQRGRAQVRLVGYNRDKGNIPDEMLNWAAPLASPFFGQHGGASSQSLTGLKKGSFVRVEFADPTGQIMWITNTLTGAGKTEDGSKLDPSERNHDINAQFRDEKTQGGDKRLVDDHKDKEGKKTEKYKDKSTTQYAMDEAPSAYKNNTAKEGPEQGKSIGNDRFGSFDFKSATKAIKGANPQNISGTIPQALELIETLKKTKGNPFMENSVGLNNLMQMFTGLADLLKQQQKTKKNEEDNELLYGNTATNNI